MGLLKETSVAWARYSDARETHPTYTQFTHKLPVFPLPRRKPLPDGDLPQVAIATPCKNASPYLETYFTLIDALDYPVSRLHLHLLEGDSTDDTFARTKTMLAARKASCLCTDLIKYDLGFDPGKGRRTRAGVQRDRRSVIAACRNRLLQATLDTEAEFILFVDIDLVAIPPDSLKQALAWNAPILMANCLIHDGTGVFDRNAFFYTRPVSDRSAQRYVRDGIYQPPAGFFRHYPEPDSSHGIEPLHAVGGTFLLIRRDVIEAGADFPEEPYQLHLETEGFALKAADLGFGAFMPPRLIVRHGPN